MLAAWGQTIKESHAQIGIVTTHGVKFSVSLAFLAGCNLLLGLASVWYVIRVCGPGSQSDALYASVALPQFIATVFSGSLINVLLPLLAGMEEPRREQAAWLSLSFYSVIACVAAAVLAATAQWWLPLFGTQWSPASLSVGITLARIQCVSMALTVCAAIAAAAYQAAQRFLLVETVNVAANLMSFALLAWALPRYGIESAAWAAVLRSGISAGTLICGLPRGNRQFEKSALAQTWLRLRPLLLGASYFKSDALLDRYLTSLAPAGTLSIFYLSQQLYTAINQVVYRAVAQPLSTELARHAAAENWPAFRRAFRRRMGVLGLLMSIALACLVFAAPHAAPLVFGENTEAEFSALLLQTLLLLAGVLLAGALGTLTSAAFHARGETALLVRLGAGTFTLGVLLKLVGFLEFGVVGLAAAASLYYLLSLVICWLVLEKRLSGTSRGNRA